MESLTYTENGVVYEIISKRRTGHWIMIQISTPSSGRITMPWVLRYPSGELERFNTEYDLWKFCLIDKKLF